MERYGSLSILILVTLGRCSSYPEGPGRLIESNKALQSMSQTVLSEDDSLVARVPVASFVMHADKGPRRVKRGLSLLDSIFRFKTLGKKKKVKAAYKDAFYNNEGWEVRLPERPRPGAATIPSNYFPNPSYGVINVMLLPPPLPPPLSKSASPQISNFGGYVGPVVYDDEEDIALEE